ncbi:hypothetical protein HETIRDRAFT_451053 [Heterobasidion irregulare TC 32-1]|uniref:Uncharacterized protein n=1 Tax=Heterobasidion irregulare (strain TC 32-1) TaxID=747525 RepID=W4KC87_HETIT|nr:uncharacterized protein HETIRDRAFT_451053 [Heterobasidion irregulare TC 32-1]ETW83482.1 hypothetical protein HETIRDRAFT_451053 [Heterobasidion irregulare TC 32-1]
MRALGCSSPPSLSLLAPPTSSSPIFPRDPPPLLCRSKEPCSYPAQATILTPPKRLSFENSTLFRKHSTRLAVILSCTITLFLVADAISDSSRQSLAEATSYGFHIFDGLSSAHNNRSTARCITFHRPSRISFAPPHEVPRETTAAFQPRRPSLNLAVRHLRRRLDHDTPFDARAGLLTAPGLFLPAALSPSLHSETGNRVCERERAYESRASHGSVRFSLYTSSSLESRQSSLRSASNGASHRATSGQGRKIWISTIDDIKDRENALSRWNNLPSKTANCIVGILTLDAPLYNWLS